MVVFSITGTSVSAQELRLSVIPRFMLPLGPNSEYVGMGGGGTLSAEYTLPFLPVLYAGLDVGYEMLAAPLSARLSVIDVGAVFGSRFWLLPWLAIRAQAAAGYYQSLLPLETGLVSGGGFTAGFSILPEAVLTDSVRLSLGPSYVLNSGLHQGLRLQAGISASLGTPGRPNGGAGPAVESPVFEALFPVFRKLYDSQPFGEAILRNSGSVPLTDVTVQFFAKQFMDAPIAVTSVSRLAPGQAVPVQFKALFNDRILEYTEATLVTAEVITEFSRAGRRQVQASTISLRVNDRNAMQWSDDRGAAAFVTARDPAVLAFARNAAAALPASVLDRNLAVALALHEALDLYGMRYAEDPKTPYVELSKNESAVDFLLFPRQTLEYKSGDCDDLSILYAAALEALGIETAFITTPGHIYLAFALSATAEEARRLFAASAADLLVRDGRAWLPLEITLRGEGFTAAWALGARQWREADRQGQAAFIDMREAWKTYEPVGLPGTPPMPSPPPPQSVSARFAREMTRLTDRELEPQLARIQAEIKQAGESPRLLNTLGLAYARFGVLDKAQQALTRAVAREEYVPALLNLGNIALLQQRFKEAGPLFSRALKKSPGNTTALLGLARASHELEDYGRVRELYAELKNRDPAMAERFAYLELRRDEASRASEAGERKKEMIWQD